MHRTRNNIGYQTLHFLDTLGSSELFTLRPMQGSNNEDSEKWQQRVSAAFHIVYISPLGRGWVSMRDYYALVKNIRAALEENVRTSGSDKLTAVVLVAALGRNFGYLLYVHHRFVLIIGICS